MHAQSLHMISYLTGYYYYSNLSNFSDNISSLLNQIPEKDKVVSLVFFGSTNDSEYKNELNDILNVVTHSFKLQIPLVSYVAQSLSDSQKMAVEVHCMPVSVSPESLTFKQLGNTRYAVFHWEHSKILSVEGVLAKSTGENLSKQADDIFQTIEAILAAESMEIHDIVRQWNYIGNITGIDHDIQNYQAFNIARTRFYEKTNWKNTGYPAATGIGSSVNALVISLIAISNTKGIHIYPVNNPLQVPAYAYSSSKLVGGLFSSTDSPKFERARVIQSDLGAICIVSGTAAIRGEESMRKLDIGLQTKQTIENIQFLISPENLTQHGLALETNLDMAGLRVYIKEKEHFDRVKEEIEKIWSNIQVIYLQADICRTELLVEIEGIAMEENRNLNVRLIDRKQRNDVVKV